MPPGGPTKLNSKGKRGKIIKRTLFHLALGEEVEKHTLCHRQFNDKLGSKQGKGKAKVDKKSSPIKGTTQCPYGRTRGEIMKYAQVYSEPEKKFPRRA